MTDETQTTETQNEVAPNELEILKGRARMLGITFSNNIKLETLRAKVAAAQDGTEAPADDDEGEDAGEDETQEVVEVNPLEKPAPLKGDYSKMTPQQRKAAIRREIRQESMRLVRVRITCMNPAKKHLEGEIFTVANGYIGTVRRFIPYGEATENGWHIEKVLLDMLKAKEYQSITQKKDKQTGRQYVHSSWVREFAIEDLPPLTEDELARLANAQAAAGSID